MTEPNRDYRSVSDLTVKVFGDGAELDGMLALYREPIIKGFTTNPTLMRKAGIVEYRGFARKVLDAIPDRPISFEVFWTSSRTWNGRRARSRPGAKTSTSRFRLPTPAGRRPTT